MFMIDNVISIFQATCLVYISYQLITQWFLDNEEKYDFMNREYFKAASVIVMLFSGFYIKNRFGRRFQAIYIVITFSCVVEIIFLVDLLWFKCNSEADLLNPSIHCLYYIDEQTHDITFTKILFFIRVILALWLQFMIS